KTTGDSGGRRSSHGHRAGKSRHRHAAADPAQGSAQPSANQVSNVTTNTHAVRAAAPAGEQAPPAPADTITPAQSAVVSAATPAQPSASGPGDAGQAGADGSVQTSNFIP